MMTSQCQCRNCEYTREHGGYMPCAFVGEFEIPHSHHRQTKFESFKEALFNVAVGIGVALPAQSAYFHFAGIETNLSQNLGMAAWMTLISITRTYLVRRYSDNKKFNNNQKKATQNE